MMACLPTSVEDEAVNSDILIPRNTDLLYQTLLIAHRAESSHKPTIAIAALTHIRCSWPIDEELRFLENFLTEKISTVCNEPTANLKNTL
jgi:hypothetical protein